MVVGVAAAVWFQMGNKNIQPIACTMEAKLCPDGTAVGRTGPNCEFAPCPEVVPAPTPVSGNGSTGTIKGSVTLSPTCPVERMPPEPQCTPKPYQTKIEVFTSLTGKLIKSTQTSADGSFALTLPFGDYTIQAGGGTMLPRCSPITVSLKTATTAIDISCDTGIR